MIVRNDGLVLDVAGQVAHSRTQHDGDPRSFLPPIVKVPAISSTQPSVTSGKAKALMTWSVLPRRALRAPGHVTLVQPHWRWQ